MNYRIALEKQILGKCLLENGFASIADFLRPENFTEASVDSEVDFCHKTIYQTIAILYPVQPITIHNVVKKLGTHTAHYLAQLQGGVCSTKTIRSEAAVLLQLNLQASFINMLQKRREGSAVPTLHQVIINEIIDEALDSDNDIFEIIEKAILYVGSYGIDFPEVQEFATQIDTRIAQIKRLGSYDTLMHHLLNLDKTMYYDTQTKIILHKLSEYIKAIVIHGKLDETTTKNLLAL